jgi:formylglycine-generating enzyme required for sulfatase activity
MRTKIGTLLAWAMAIPLIFGLLSSGVSWAGESQPPKELELDLGGGVKLELVLIPAGKFIMGSPNKKDNQPQHEVTLSQSYYMGKYPVTQEQYEKVMGANPSKLKGANDPVDFVSWDNAQDFCKKVSATSGKIVRLPTEAEREYACRAGSTTAFCFGDNDKELGAYAWFKDNSDNKTHPVGEKKPNAWGLYDMHGNVWEWCQNWDGEDAAGPATDPQGPAQGTHRVWRGGCWAAGPLRCTSTNRTPMTPNQRHNDAGFRVVVEAPKTP